MTGGLLLAATTLLRPAALRREAVRDAVASALVDGLQRTVLSAMLVGAILGITLFEFVLPMLPYFGSRPEELARLFLFSIQHLGDLVAAVLVVGQAGVPVTLQLWELRERQRFTSVAAGGMNPVEVFVLPRVWGLAVLYVIVGMLLKVTGVVVAVLVNWILDGRFLGGEIGSVVESTGGAILGGYVLNSGVAILVAVACCAPVMTTSAQSTGAAPVGRVFRHALVLIVTAKLLFFVV